MPRLVLIDDEYKKVEEWEINWYYSRLKDLSVLADEITDRIEGLTPVRPAQRRGTSAT